MSIETFFENFELLTDAPNAVTKLREIILQLAVHGKLVPQNLIGNPITLVLEEVLTEQSLNKGRKTKKNLLDLCIAELSYVLPKNWKWHRLGNLGITQTGTTPATSNLDFYGNDYPFIKPADITNSGINYGTDGLSKLGIKKGRFVPENSVLMVSIGGSIGKVGYVNRDCSCNQQINYITLNSGIFPKLIYYFLKSLYFQEQVLSQAPSTTMPILSKGKWDTIPVPIPPLVEQKRIVEKCDRLMSLCDQIEVRQQKRQESIVRMNESAIAQLLSSQNPGEFRQHWQRICNNFDLLYSIPETIPKLRQAILQLAVQGKLVRQDPNNEPADALLKRIRAERINRETNPKIKNQIFEEPDITGLYKLPKSWIWTTASQVCYLIIDGDHNPPKRVLIGIPHLTAKNIANNRIQPNGCTFITEEDFKRVKKRYFPESGDVILTCVGTLGRTAIVTENLIFSADRNLAILRPVTKFILPKYIQLILNGPQMQAYIASADGSTAQPHIYLKQIRALMCPLPPIDEQKRIVAKVDRLMSLCDTLEGKLKEARSHSETLMEVVAKQVLVA